MPSKSRKLYYEKKRISKKKRDEEENPKQVRLEKSRRPGSKTIGVIYFILAIIASIFFTISDLLIPGILVTSVLIFFSIKNFRDAPVVPV